MSVLHLHEPEAPAPAVPPDMPLFELTTELIESASVEERDVIVTDLEKWGMLRLPFPRIAIKFPQEPIAKLLGWQPMPINPWTTMWCEAKGPLKVIDLYLTSDPKTDDERPIKDEEMDKLIGERRAHCRRVVIPELISTQVYSEYRKRGGLVNLNEADAETVAKGGYKNNQRPVTKDYQAMFTEALTVLLASLAARNVIKDVRYNASRPVGGKFVPCHMENGGITYLSRTVIRPPKIEELDDADNQTTRSGLSKMFLVRGYIRNQVADTTVPQPPNTRITVVGKGRLGRREQWIAPFYKGVDFDYAPPRHYVVKP